MVAWAAGLIFVFSGLFETDTFRGGSVVGFAGFWDFGDSMDFG